MIFKQIGGLGSTTLQILTSIEGCKIENEIKLNFDVWQCQTYKNFGI